MKTSIYTTALFLLFLNALNSCKKSESGSYGSTSDIAADSTSSVDEISSAASFKVKDKQFIKSAGVELEVGDVYESTIWIEKSLQEMGGFVTSSQLNSNIISEKTFSISDQKAMMVRRFQTQNIIKVRVPTEKLSEFLKIINDKKIFLNSRNILAEDVTSNIRLSKLEKERNTGTGKNIAQLNINKDKVALADENKSESNYQKVADFDMKDNLEYSTVQIFLKEPQIRVAQIPVVNNNNIDNQYQYNFFYEAKNAVVEGFYLIQKIVIGLFTIWPLLLIGCVIVYFYRRKNKMAKSKETKISE